MKKRSFHRWLALAAAVVAMVPAGAAAKPVPAGVFGDHAVLQRDEPVPIWGTADAGETVTVSFAGQDVTAVAGPDGAWKATLAALPASAEPRDLVIRGADKTFVWADARIDGETVVVSSPQIAEPVAVRFAWGDNPEGFNLYNGAGLPAAPFRTDGW